MSRRGIVVQRADKPRGSKLVAPDGIEQLCELLETGVLEQVEGRVYEPRPAFDGVHASLADIQWRVDPGRDSAEQEAGDG